MILVCCRLILLDTLLFVNATALILIKALLKYGNRVRVHV